MHIEVPRPVSTEGLNAGMTSAQMRELVLVANERQLARIRPGDRPLSELAGVSLRRAVSLTVEAEQMLRWLLMSLA